MNFWIFVFKTQKLSETEPSVWRSLTDGVDVRRQRAQRSAPVLLDGVGRVKLWDVKVRVHCDQDVGYKCLDEEEEMKKGNTSQLL